MADTNPIKLTVKEAQQDDIDRGIVRIDAETIQSLGIKRGEIIEIEGARKTVARVDRAYPMDIGQSIIRMDGSLRRNAKAGLDEAVTLRKADVKDAKTIVVAPAQKGLVIQGDPEFLKRGLIGKAVVKGDQVALGGSMRRRVKPDTPFPDIFGDFGKDFEMFERSIGNLGLSVLRLIVVDVNPKQAVIITAETQVTFNPEAVEVAEEKVIDVTYEDIGGLDEELKKVREMIEIPLKYPELFNKLGIEPPAGVLLHGPPGSGKTLLAKAVANESDANFILLNGPEIMNKFYGESEKKVREVFEQAEKQAPSIVFIDEIDSIAPKREETHGEVERRVVSQLLTMMDGLKSRGKVVVIGATNRPNAIDPALRRPGRFDREITLGVPQRAGRLQILKIHTRNMPLLIPVTKLDKDKDGYQKKVDTMIEKLADITHGFVGADLAALCKEAAMNVLRKIMPSLNLREKKPIDKGLLDNLCVTEQDFREALKVVRPSALREVLIETPKIGWKDIGGLEKIKQELKEAVEWPLKHREAFTRMGIRPPRGILLYGPPGTGKTLLAKAVAKESEANFIQIKGPSLLNKWVGESEKGVRSIFEKARQSAPSIIFFDEIDALAPKRGMFFGSSHVTENVVNTLLAEMDGLEDLHDVVVIGATNRPDIIDPALLRPGRFDRLLLTDTPDIESRLEIFKIHTQNMPLAKDVNIKVLSEKTEGYVGSDIESVCREAAMLALREDMKSKEVKKKHFEEAMAKIKLSVPKDAMDRYKSIEEDYLRNAKAALREKTPSYMG